MRAFILLISLSITLFACSSQSGSFERGKKFTSKSGKGYIVTYIKGGNDSKGSIKIELKGFKDNTGFTFKSTDPVERCFFNDLDKDGYEELYIITASQSRNILRNIYGMASIRDLKAEHISAPDQLFRNQTPGGFYEAFQAFNFYQIEDSVLTEVFPVNRESDLYSRGIDTAVVFMELFLYENQWVLNPFQQKHMRIKD